jgi:hypothetical protein
LTLVITSSTFLFWTTPLAKEPPIFDATADTLLHFTDDAIAGCPNGDNSNDSKDLPPSRFLLPSFIQHYLPVAQIFQLGY